MANGETQLDTQIARAAVMRAGGAQWRQIGEALGRAEITVRHYPDKYPDKWAAAYALAHATVVTEGVSEAVHTLRAAMRHEDPNVRVRAAHSFWTNAIKERPTDINLNMVGEVADSLVGAIQRFVPEEHREAAAETVREQLGG